jgi:nitroreductase
METLRALYLRRTVRRFKDRKIPEKILLRILDAGNQAPKAGNLQSVKYYVVTDPDLKEKVAKAAAHQTWLAKAPVLVVICSRTSIVKKSYGKRGEMYAIQNSSLAAQNILIAATAAKVGSAFVSALAEKTLRRYLEIPDEIDPHAIIALGYPERMPKAPAKLSLGEIVYFNEWQKKSNEKSIYPIGEKLKKK